MWNYLWPVVLVVLSNCVYNISTKSTPSSANAFCSLAVTYFLSGIISLMLYFSQCGVGKIFDDIHKLNWTAPVLGLSILGLEFGYIFMYRAGWKISLGSLVSNITLACALVIIGMLLYKESISLKQIAGMIVCLLGLILVSRP